jgi:hypothetical protein
VGSFLKEVYYKGGKNLSSSNISESKHRKCFVEEYFRETIRNINREHVTVLLTTNWNFMDAKMLKIKRKKLGRSDY